MSTQTTLYYFVYFCDIDTNKVTYLELVRDNMFKTLFKDFSYIYSIVTRYENGLRFSKQLIYHYIDWLIPCFLKGLSQHLSGVGYFGNLILILCLPKIAFNLCSLFFTSYLQFRLMNIV